MRSSSIRPQQVCAGGSRAVVRLSVTCWRFSSWSAGLSACRDVLLVTGERGARGGYFRKVNGFSILSHTEQTGDHATNDVPERRSSKGAAEQQPLSTAPPSAQLGGPPGSPSPHEGPCRMSFGVWIVHMPRAPVPSSCSPSTRREEQVGEGQTGGKHLLLIFGGEQVENWRSHRRFTRFQFHLFVVVFFFNFPRGS